MKKIYTIAFLFLATIGFAQIPAGYYNTATGTGYTLKTQLYNKIHAHTALNYTPGLWNAYPFTDARPDGKVWDIYSNCNFTFGTGAGGNQDQGSGGTAECQFYNREHTFPKSWFADGTPMYTDLFHVMPTDKKVNGLRGNLAYGVVGTATYTSSNGTKKGNCIAPNYPYNLEVFEPADEYKGDIARNYFYMATCYQNVISGWQTNDADADTALDGSSDKVFEQWYLDLMYSWHVADPVSAKEIARNNAVYNIQGNRNPFIDHPEYVLAIWGPVLSTATFSNALATVSVYPNPSSNRKINIESDNALEEIQLITINGQLMQQIKNPVMENHTFTIENLPQGFYFLKLSADHQSVTKKVIVN
ncbi:MAG TPA: endonuclease [Flavobacterium sp.]|nr:endonuclease [Flavobacterium sp.]